jgi:hypothetical protein
MAATARAAWLTLLVLAVILAGELRLGPQKATDSGAIDVGPTESSTGESLSIAPVYTLSEPEAFDDLSQRPLFLASRRPPEPEPAKKKPNKPRQKVTRQPKFALSAIVRERNRWIAFVETVGRPPAVEVEVGSVVAGWEVARIDADGVVLQKGKQKIELTLRSY